MQSIWTVISVSPIRFRVRNGPLPGRGVRRPSVPVHEVREIESRQVRNRDSYYSLWAHLEDGSAVLIVPELGSSFDGPALKHLIERQLRAPRKSP